MTVRITKILVGTSLAVLLVYGCSSREFRKLDTTRTTDTELSHEDQIARSQALSLVNLGNKDFREGNYPKALDNARRSLEIFPTADAYYLSANTHSKTGKNELAKSDLISARKLDPDNEQVLISLGVVLSTLGEDDSALEVYSDLSQRFPKEPVYRFRKAIQLKSLSRYSESLRVLDEISVEEFPHKTEYYAQKGDVHLKLKNYSEAEKYLALATESAPNSQSLKANTRSIQTASHLERGNQAMRAKDYPSAISAYKNAAQLDPKNPSPKVFLANAYTLHQEYAQSEKILADAYALNDEFLPTLEAYSVLYYKSKNYNRSLEWAERGSKLAPKSDIFLNRIGLAKWKLGDTRSAALFFRKAIDVKPNFFEAEANLGYLLMEERRFGEAKKIFQSLIERNPNQKWEYESVSLLATQAEIIESGDRFLQDGKFSLAIKKYDQAKEWKVDEPLVWNAYGRAFFVNLDLKKSEANYNQALALDENNLTALQGLARVYSKMKNRSKESQIMGRLESLTQGDPTAKILVGRLKEDEGQFLEAEKVYLSIRKAFPDHEAVGIRLGSLYYKLALEKNSEEKYDEALSYLQKAKKENSNISELGDTERIIRENQKFSEILPLIRIANKAYDARKYSVALESYTAAYKKSPRANLLVKIAECHVGMGEEERALSLLRSAAESHKGKGTDYKEAIYSFYLQKGEVDRAEKGFQDVLAENPGSYYSYYKLGLIELGRKKYDQALSYLDKSLVLNFNFPAGNVAKGVVFYRKGDTALAKEEFDIAKTKDEEMDIALFNLGVLYFNQSMDAEARKVFQELVIAHPDSPEAYYQLSYLDFKERKWNSAEKNIVKAIELERTPEHLFAYARILDVKKNTAKRQDTIREILQKFPNSPEAKKLRSEVLDQEPMLAQDTGLSGVLVATPFQVGDILVTHSGTSLVATDLRSQDRIWRSFTKQEFRLFGFKYRLYGVGQKSITSWDILTGREMDSQENILFSDYEPIHLSILKSGNIAVAYRNAESTVLVTYQPNLKISETRVLPGSWNFLQKPGEDVFFAWGKMRDKEYVLTEDVWESLGDGSKQAVTLVSDEGVFGFFRKGRGTIGNKTQYFDGKDWKDWGVSVDSHLATEDLILLRSGRDFWQWDASDNLRKLEFVTHDAQTVLPWKDGYLVVQNKAGSKGVKASLPTGGSIHYFGKDGKLRMSSAIPETWVTRKNGLLLLTIQDLNLSK